LNPFILASGPDVNGFKADLKVLERSPPIWAGWYPLVAGIVHTAVATNLIALRSGQRW